MKRLFSVLFMAFALTAFMSCSKDDDNASSNNGNGGNGNNTAGITNVNIADNGNEIVATYNQGYGTYTASVEEVYTFEDGVCVSAVKRFTYPTAEIAAQVYAEMTNNAKGNPIYTLDGNVILADYSEEFAGMTKGEVTLALQMILNYGNGTDPDDDTTAFAMEFSWMAPLIGQPVATASAQMVAEGFTDISDDIDEDGETPNVRAFMKMGSSLTHQKLVYFRLDDATLTKVAAVVILDQKATGANQSEIVEGSLAYILKERQLFSSNGYTLGVCGGNIVTGNIDEQPSGDSYADSIQVRQYTDLDEYTNDLRNIGTHSSITGRWADIQYNSSRRVETFVCCQITNVTNTVGGNIVIGIHDPSLAPELGISGIGMDDEEDSDESKK